MYKSRENSLRCYSMIYHDLRHHIIGLMKVEEGSSLVYLAIVLFALIIMAGFAIDGSNAFRQNRTMQNAADAAALAGARTLALQQSNAQVANDATTLATTNGATSTGVGDITIAGDEVQADVAVEFDTYFARLIPGWSKMTIGSSAAAKYEPVTLPPEVIPIAFHRQCVENFTPGDPITFTPPLKTYCSDDVEEYWNGIHFTFWLPTLDPLSTGGGSPYSYYSLVPDSGRLHEYDDGTAVWTGSVVNPDNEGFTFQVNLDGRTANLPAGSPKFGPVISDPDEWYYYTSLNGTLWGMPGGRYDGAEISITRYGPAFQIGVGADYHEGNYHGGASWFTWTVITQPTTGVPLKPTRRGDINTRLSDCTDTEGPGGNGGGPGTNSCEFVWLDVNNGNGSSASDIENALQNPSNDNFWRVGDTVPGGPASGGGITIQVESSLQDLIGEPYVVPVFGTVIDNNDELSYILDGFAQMELQSLDFTNGPGWIVVEFQPGVVQAIETDPNADDFGLRDVYLIR